VRDRVKISTKVGAEPIGPGEWPGNREGLSERAVRDAFAGSLDRLGTDRVDLLWAHMEDRSVPIEETVEVLSDMVRSGSVDRIGASNHPAWRVERARAHAAAVGARAFSALQLSRSYLSPRPGALPSGQDHRFGMMSDEHVDYAVENGLELWAYTPLLSGAYDNPAKPIPDVYDHPGTARKLAALDRVAGELGASRGQVALAWLAGGAPQIRPILGGSKPDQLEIALDAMQLTLSAGQRALLDDVEP
jgi:aryl-alcohol dehydrogenase-like predicted oxidoreductase